MTYVRVKSIRANKYTANNVTQCDPFVYLWENDNNGKRYIGVHNGSKGYTYACSGSQIVEDFNQDPAAFHRVILEHSTSYEYVKNRELYYLRHFKVGGNNGWYNLFPMTDEEQRRYREEQKKRLQNIAKPASRVCFV